MYILDTDPKKCAVYLIREHVFSYLSSLERTFSRAHGTYSKCVKINIGAVTYSKENYLWFSEFYESLLDVYSSYKETGRAILPEFDKNFLYNTEGITFEGTGLKLPSVLDFNYMKYKVYKMKKFINRAEDNISKNRIVYILNDYKRTRFVSGVPAWYTSLGEEQYSSYSKIDRKKVKITAVDGHYKYYVATYAENWEEIPNVPQEIKYFINSLLYN